MPYFLKWMEKIWEFLNFYSTEEFIPVGSKFFWKTLKNLLCPFELSLEYKELAVFIPHCWWHLGSAWETYESCRLRLFDQGKPAHAGMTKELGYEIEHGGIWAGSLLVSSALEYGWWSGLSSLSPGLIGCLRFYPCVCSCGKRQVTRQESCFCSWFLPGIVDIDGQHLCLTLGWV